MWALIFVDPWYCSVMLVCIYSSMHRVWWRLVPGHCLRWLMEKPKLLEVHFIVELVQCPVLSSNLENPSTYCSVLQTWLIFVNHLSCPHSHLWRAIRSTWPKRSSGMSGWNMRSSGTRNGSVTWRRSRSWRRRDPGQWVKLDSLLFTAPSIQIALFTTTLWHLQYDSIKSLCCIFTVLYPCTVHLFHLTLLVVICSYYIMWKPPLKKICTLSVPALHCSVLYM